MVNHYRRRHCINHFNFFCIRMLMTKQNTGNVDRNPSTIIMCWLLASTACRALTTAPAFCNISRGSTATAESAVRTVDSDCWVSLGAASHTKTHDIPTEIETKDQPGTAQQRLSKQSWDKHDTARVIAGRVVTNTIACFALKVACLFVIWY